MHAAFWGIFMISLQDDMIIFYGLFVLVSSMQTNSYMIFIIMRYQSTLENFSKIEGQRFSFSIFILFRVLVFGDYSDIHSIQFEIGKNHSDLKLE